jgi:hypothetical protein
MSLTTPVCAAVSVDRGLNTVALAGPAVATNTNVTRRLRSVRLIN